MGMRASLVVRCDVGWPLDQGEEISGCPRNQLIINKKKIQREYIDAAFGVDWRNGMARPWAVGATPDHSLSGSGLSGTAQWTGELVGFTPSREAVHGNAKIQISIETLIGNAAFTGLERWATGTQPGVSGTGAIWGDGDLRYSISMDGGAGGQSTPEYHSYYQDVVQSNFRSYGGDEGTVNGRFVGSQHQGVVGTLERSDLTAAFGGKR